MNKKYNTIISLICMLLVVVLGLLGPETAQSKIITNVKPDISAEQLKAIVIEDFENQADQSKWAVESTPRMLKNPKKPEDNPVESLELKYIDGFPSDLIPEKWAANNRGLQAKKCLGIHFKFKYPGHNSVHIIPKESIGLPGRSKGISMWFHGRGNEYKLECWVEDFNGNTHILKFGSVNFVGWRPIKTYIPINIPQKIESYPQTRWLKIKRFVIRAEPGALSVDTYMFIDQIKVLTDDYEVNFDGQDLHKTFKSGTAKK